MIPSVIFFLIGCCSVCFFSDTFPIKTIFIIASLFLILSLFDYARKFKIHWVFAFFLGFFWIHLSIERHLIHQLPETIEGEAITVVGTISSLPEQQESKEEEKIPDLWQTQDDCIHFEFDIQKTIPETLWKKPGKVRLRLNLPPFNNRYQFNNSYQIGDLWQFTIKLKKPHRYANPGSFDKERHFFANRWVAEGSVVDNAAKVLIHRDLKSNFINRSIDRLRSRIHDSIFHFLAQSPYAGILSALILGSKDGISKEQWAIFRDTGTAHLMAISGLHVGLIAGAIFTFVIFIYRFLPLYFYRVPAPIVAAYSAIFGSLFYALLAGFSIPTQRSVIMIATFMLGIILRRQISAWHSYFFALGLILLFDPLAILSSGFWLSFSAVGVIMFGMRGRLFASSSKRTSGLWWRFGRTQWVAFLGLIPISLAIFQQTSLVSPLANIISIPVVSLGVVPFALLGGILLPFWTSCGLFLLTIAENVMKILWPFLNVCGHFPKATWILASLSLHELLLAFGGILLLLMPTGFPGRKLGLIALLPLFFIKPTTPELNQFQFTLLDVGQGLACVIETKNHVLIFDTGPKLNAEFDTGERVVIPYLATRNRSKIDTLILSHGDNDHVGGLKSIMNKIPVEKIISSELHLAPQAELCYAGQKWVWDGVEFEMLHPNTTKTRKRNDHSCVLRVQSGPHAVLLTGDIETPSEQIMLHRMRDKLSAEILLVPHHGSRTSSSKEFIQAVNPIYALFPVGYRNSYGHPKPDIVERYREHGAILLDSVKDGAITFMVDKDKISKPVSYRRVYANFWNN